MKLIVYIVIVIYLIISLALFSVDFYHFLLNRYCRFHIGRFNSDEEWSEKVINKGKKWLKKTPVVKITDNSRYILLDKINGKYKSNTIQSWQKGALLLGLQDIENEACKDLINRLIDNTGNFINKPTNVDCGLLSYAILKNSDPKFVKPAMDYAKDIIINNIGDDDMISYVRNKNADERYVDSIGLTTPFLAYYGKVYDDKQTVDIAIKQLKLFSKYGLEKESLLPNHAFSKSTKLPLGVYGWGRGCAWYVIGLIDTYFELEDSDEKNWLKLQIKTIADSYIKYQRSDGGFGHIFQMTQGYDSSATSVMAYFYKQCSIVFENKEYENIYKRCLLKLKEVTRITGSLDWCQGDTKGIGIFAQTYDIMPFAQGFLIRSYER